MITSLPNTNVADAIGRLPSVSLERDEGEGKYIQIRGTEPRLTNVTVDGMHLASPESVRNVKLDVIPADLVDSVASIFPSATYVNLNSEQFALKNLARESDAAGNRAEGELPIANRPSRRRRLVNNARRLRVRSAHRQSPNEQADGRHAGATSVG